MVEQAGVEVPAGLDGRRGRGEQAEQCTGPGEADALEESNREAKRVIE